MVLGLRTRNRKGASVQIDYVIHIHEIKPWPPSQSLRSLRTVILQWENGEKNSGSLGPVAPTIGSVVGEGKIEFNESINLAITLSREVHARGGESSTYQRNCLELSLYEPRRDKIAKGQLLGNVTIDLAEYGILKEPVSFSFPMNCKRSYRNTTQPVLFGKIQPLDKTRNGSSSPENMSEESTLDKESKESVSALMNEEYAEEEAEIASFTDDDVSSHSSLTISSLAFDATGNSPSKSDTPDVNRILERNSAEAIESTAGNKKGSELTPEQEIPESKMTPASSSSDQKLSQPPSSDSSSNSGQQTNDVSSVSKLPQGILPVYPASSSSLNREVDRKVDDSSKEDKDNYRSPAAEQNGTSSEKNGIETSNSTSQVPPYDNVSSNGQQLDICNNMHQTDIEGKLNYTLDEMKYAAEKSPSRSPDNFSQMTISTEEVTPVNRLRRTATSGSDPLALNRRSFNVKNNNFSHERLKSLNFTEVNETDMVGEAYSYSRSLLPDRTKGDWGSKRLGADIINRAYREVQNTPADAKVQKLECKIEILEAELREVASLEVSIYSIVAEHGSSTQKVHAPARRLSRLYIHASKQLPRERRASAAKSVISGLVCVAKACGNDVPRLTFWLSNSLVLRAIITEATGATCLPVSVGIYPKENGSGRSREEKSSSLSWKESTPQKNGQKLLSEESEKWEDPQTFISALEKIETWMFSRIIESVWWQTLTPHMQSEVGFETEQKRGSPSKKGFLRKSSLGYQQQDIFSINLWKRAFKDACERICPVRAAGHECGCLPVLAKLVMEQCVARLDVAMFNAILRESDDDNPTDPISDPISNSKVLPIPAGRTSFGAGAQLKNAIGNWSRWLTDLFGLDADDSPNGEIENNDREDPSTAFKSFRLLNALSDLLMLPKDLLFDSSIRKEVCPTFGALLLKRVLNTFVPDEFCPDPIPENLLEALDTEDHLMAEDESIRHFPCSAAPIVYLPPSTAVVSGVVGDIGSRTQLRRSGSSVLRRGQTSDDELDELDMPLKSIIVDNRQCPTSTPGGLKGKQYSYGTAVRFHLLREVWRDEE
ncbi:hypothetical protein H6P81_013282 [Aristolochia fimbriata]|uniref:C2 NT-type domain-containing protein n=1 Tax=Aristolochia fimbriata TaxID=158543 RepID=A0AAV7EEN6_ARIFI|nr:hypothetical protein H6P81_013282 [Aristolochia fimbriata]